jgi:hypothetical protein
MDRRIKPTAVRLSDSGDTKIVVPAKRVAREPGPMITGISRATVRDHGSRIARLAVRKPAVFGLA